MSEVETSSSRLRRGAKERHSYGGGAAQAAPRPRTSPSQPSRSPGPLGAGRTPGPSSALFEEVCRYLDISTLSTLYLYLQDPGIMSEAETSSTRRKLGHASATASLPRNSGPQLGSLHQQHSAMFDEVCTYLDISTISTYFL